MTLSMFSHPELEGKHAFLSPSKYHWLRYSESKLIQSWETFHASERGTILHDFAKRCIDLGIKLKDETSSLGQFVNDSIRYKMKAEQQLYYSDLCFGTADAIKATMSRHIFVLRIHDYKSGKTPASMDQLKIYAALYFLEYGIPDAKEIQIVLTIYQGGHRVKQTPSFDEIVEVMNIIKRHVKILEDRR